MAEEGIKYTGVQCANKWKSLKRESVYNVPTNGSLLNASILPLLITMPKVGMSQKSANFTKN